MDRTELKAIRQAYDVLAKAHREIIALLHALPELAAPDPVPATTI